MKSEIKIIIFSILLAGCNKQSSNYSYNSARALELYKKETCITCHSLDGTRRMGPSLKGIYGNKVELTNGNVVERDDEYLRDAIVKPDLHIVKGYPSMINSFSHLSDTEIEILIRFIKELK